MANKRELSKSEIENLMKEIFNEGAKCKDSKGDISPKNILDNFHDLCFEFDPKTTALDAMPSPTVGISESYIPSTLIMNYETFPTSLPNANELTDTQKQVRISYINKFLKTRITQLLSQAFSAAIGGVEAWLCQLSSTPEYSGILDISKILYDFGYIHTKQRLCEAVVTNSSTPLYSLFSDTIQGHSVPGKFIFPIIKIDDVQFCESKTFIGSIIYSQFLTTYSNIFSMLPQSMLVFMANNVSFSYQYYFDYVIKQLSYEITILGEIGIHNLVNPNRQQRSEETLLRGW